MSQGLINALFEGRKKICKEFDGCGICPFNTSTGCLICKTVSKIQDLSNSYDAACSERDRYATFIQSLENMTTADGRCISKSIDKQHYCMTYEFPACYADELLDEVEKHDD